MKHLFICVNERPEGCRSCAGNGSIKAFECAKRLANRLNIPGKREIKVTKTGCMGHCSDGPVAVVYPQGNWYGYKDIDGITTVMMDHLINDKKVEPLIINE